MRIIVSVLLTLLLLSFPASSRSAGSPPPDAGGAPSASDLFHAQRRADEARRRLELPRVESRGWKHGGEGWGASRGREETTPAPGGQETR